MEHTTVIEFITHPWGELPMTADVLNAVKCSKDTVREHGDSVHVTSVVWDGWRFTIKSQHYAPIANIEAWCQATGGLISNGYSFSEERDGTALSFFGTSYPDPNNQGQETIILAVDYYDTVPELFFNVLDFDKFKEKMGELFENTTRGELDFIKSESDREELIDYLWLKAEHRKSTPHELESIYNEDPGAWLHVMQTAYAQGATKEEIASEHPYAEDEALNALLTLIPKQ